MSITDELRKWASVEVPYKYGHQLNGIADRIDERHKHAIGYVDDRDPETMAENGWVRLPKDADGEYIRAGDVMRFGDVKRDLTVLGIGIYGECDHDIGVFVREGDDYVWYNARFLHHHHAPTVEDVLDEIVDKANSIGCAYASNDMSGDEMMDALKAIVAEYAAKLRLAGDEE